MKLNAKLAMGILSAFILILFIHACNEGKEKQAPQSFAGKAAPANYQDGNKYYLAYTQPGEIYRPKIPADVDTVFITGNNYSVIEFFGVQRAANDTLVITTTQPVTAATFRIKGFSDYVKVIGKFKSNGGLAINLSSHITIDGMEITNPGGVGIYCKQDASYGDKTTYGSSGYVMTGITFRNSYIHDTEGESAYIGPTQTTGIVVRSTWSGKDTSIVPISLDSVIFENNRCENAGWDGPQFAMVKNAWITGNTIKNTGIKRIESQTNGLVIGSKTRATVTGNTIENSAGAAVVVFGYGLITISGNTLNNGGTMPNQDAIYIAQKEGNSMAKLQVNISNNIIKGQTRNGIRNDGNSSNALPGIWAGNIITTLGSIAKYQTSIGDVIADTPPVVIPRSTPTIKSVTVLYSDGSTKVL